MIIKIEVESVKKMLEPIVEETLTKLNKVRVMVMEKCDAPIDAAKEIMYELLLLYNVMVLSLALTAENNVARLILATLEALEEEKGGEEDEPSL